MTFYTNSQSGLNDDQGRIYGSSDANRIILETGAQGELINFSGHNSIQIQSPSEIFTISRSGSVVIFQGLDGTFLKIAATTSEQTIFFSDGMIVALTIDNNQAMLGSRSIGTEPEPLSNGA